MKSKTLQFYHFVKNEVKIDLSCNSKEQCG